MKDILNYYASLLNGFSQTIKKKGILVDQPWALIDEENCIQKLIFRKNNSLILSKNGVVTEGSWEYFPQSRALLIDRGTDKLLLNECYIDTNVLILKKDGTDNDFFAFANENFLPDYNIPQYLNSVQCKELKIKEIKLINGNILQIHEAKELIYYEGLKASVIDNKFNNITLEDGKYLTDNKETFFVIKGGTIIKVITNSVKKLSGGGSFEIEYGEIEPLKNIGKRVYMNGESISNTSFMDHRNTIYTIRENIISRIVFLVEYMTGESKKILIEQKDKYKIRKGDKILEYNNYSGIPDGSYKIKGKLWKIKVENNNIV